MLGIKVRANKFTRFSLQYHLHICSTQNLILASTNSSNNDAMNKYVLIKY